MRKTDDFRNNINHKNADFQIFLVLALTLVKFHKAIPFEAFHK